MTPPNVTTQPVAVGLRVASTLCWICGILVALASLAVLIPSVMLMGFGVGAMIGLAMTVLGAAYCVAGYQLRKASLFGAVLALTIAVITSLLQLNMNSRGAYIALALNLAIAVLVIINWKHLRRPVTTTP